MATPIKQIKTSDNVLHDIQGVEYIVGTQTKNTNLWTGVTQVDELYDGMAINYKLPYAGTTNSNTHYGTTSISTLELFDKDGQSLGWHPVFRNANSVFTTAYAVDSVLPLVFDANYSYTYNSVSHTGAWKIADYDSNTNTIGYQLRTNSSTMPMKQITYRYRLLFTSLDGQGWVPANTSSSTSATASKTVNQAVIDPFGEIVYYGTTASVAAGSNPSVTALWQQYTLTLGYSFNRTGAALVLPYPKPIYVKAAPQTGGGVIIDATTPYVTELPTTEDGKVYIYLGRTYSATAIELTMNHPVYYYKGGEIREWTNAEPAPTVTVSQTVVSGTEIAKINGTSIYVPVAEPGVAGITKVGASGGAASYSHTHALSDITGAAPLASPSFTGTPTAPTPSSGASSTAIANKGYVDSVLGGITQIDYAVTSTLPVTGEKGTIYLVGHTHGTNDIYDEYIDTNQSGSWEKIGNTDVDLSDYIEVIDVGDLAVADLSTFAFDLFVNGYAYATTTISSDLRTEILNKFHNNACAIKGTIASYTPFLLLNEGRHDYDSAYEYKVFSGTSQFHLNNILHSYVVNVNISTNTAAPDFITIMALANEYELEEKIGYDDLSITPTLNSGTEIATITAVQNGVDVIAATLYAPSIPTTAATPTNDLDIANKIYVDTEIENVSEVGPEDYLTFTLGASTTMPAMAGTLPIYPIICEDTDITSFSDFNSLPKSKKNKITVYIPGENDDYTRHVFYLQNHSSDIDGNVYWYTSNPDNIIDSSSGSVHSNTHIIMISDFVEYVTSSVYYGALIKEDYQKDVRDLSSGIASLVIGDFSVTSNFATGVTIGGVGFATQTNFYVPIATSLVAGVTTVGDGIGAADYYHNHYVHTTTVISGYAGSQTNIYPAANVTAVTGITNTATNVLSSVTGTTFGISVSNGVLEIGSTIGISSLSPSTTSVVRTVSASGTSSVRGTSVSVMNGLGTVSTESVVTAVNNAFNPEQQS